MTLSKQTITQDFRRMSFDERVCDDLSEVLLQFLPIEDKFRFECVSKQFQRTVFQKQYDLDMYRIMKGKGDLHLYLAHFMNQNMKSSQLLEKFVKILPNIESLNCWPISEASDDSDIDIIVKYCHKLTKIHLNCDFNLISAEKRDSFATKFGPKLVSIIARNGSLQWFREWFPKIEKLNLEDNWFQSHQLLSIRFNNLKKLSISVSDVGVESGSDSASNSYFDESSQKIENNFKKFIQNNKRLTHLSIYLDFKPNSMETVFKYMSQLDQLVSLNIGTEYMSHTIDGLRQLSSKCLKLKRLSVNYFDDSALIPSFMTEVKKFKTLERLWFGLRLEDYDDLQTFEEYFKGLQSLTHLAIYLLNIKHIKKDLLKDIDKSLPKLRVLRIRKASNEVSEETADSLARLSKLEYIRLDVNNESIRDLIVNKVTKNCRKIKSIDIKVI